MMYDTESPATDSDNKETELTNQEIQQIIIAKQAAILDEQIRKFNDICWDACVQKAGAKLDGKTENCLVNCVNRFIDTTLYIANRFTHSLARGGGR